MEFEVNVNPKNGKHIAVRVIRIGDEREPLPRVCGVCFSWLEGKDFGFIKADGFNENLFVHRRDLMGRDRLEEGDRVECEVGVNRKNNKKGNALRVVKIGGAPHEKRTDLREKRTAVNFLDVDWKESIQTMEKTKIYDLKNSRYRTIWTHT